MAGERPSPQNRLFNSEVIVVHNPDFTDPEAQAILDKARKLGFPVTGVIMGARTEIKHTAASLPDAVAETLLMARKLLANPVTEVVRSVTTSVADPLTPKDQQ